MRGKDALSVLLQQATNVIRQTFFEGILVGVFGPVLALFHAVQYGLVAQSQISLGLKPQAVQGCCNAA